MERVGNASKGSKTGQFTKMRNKFESNKTVSFPARKRDTSVPAEGKLCPNKAGRGNKCAKSPGVLQRSPWKTGPGIVQTSRYYRLSRRRTKMKNLLLFVNIIFVLKYNYFIIYGKCVFIIR